MPWNDVRPDESHDSHLTILNRIVSLDKSTGTVSYEAGPRHAEMIVRQFQLENAKSVTTPAEKKKLADVISASVLPQLDTKKTTLYRSLVMRAQFLGQDRADLSEAVKSLTRKMRSPTGADMKDLKRLARYLVGRPRVVAVYKPQRDSKVLKVHYDSERRSTTGFTDSIGLHCVKHESWPREGVVLKLAPFTWIELAVDHFVEFWGVRVLRLSQSQHYWNER